MRTFILSGILACLSPWSPAEIPTPYNSEPGSPMPAEEAAASMLLPEGFECVVFAAEPDVQQPIAMNWDAKGRLWVAECYTYAENPDRWDTDLRDRILILEDHDGDGRHDKRTVFWDEGIYLTSVEIGYGGVWVLHNGTLSFVADEDGDDVPDGKPQVLLDGFKTETIGHNIVNGLRWGPDGWLYGRHGITDTSAVGKPGTPAAERTRLNCSIWRYHPTREIFEVVCHGGTNSWGHDWNGDGDLFYINTVIGHLWHAIPGAYYERMFGSHLNPHVYKVIGHTADHVHWDVGSEKWSDIRGGITDKTSQLGGGHAHVGMLIYQGGLWPQPYHGAVLTCNLHGRRINMETLHREGCGYVGRHAPDFMQATDPWFRGVELSTGPDGNVFVADWSDTGECHDNDGVHRTSGRIYKIVYGGATTRRLSKNTTGDGLSPLNGRPGSIEDSLPGMEANQWWVRRNLQRAFESGSGPKPRSLSTLEDCVSPEGHVRLRAASDLQRLPLEARWPMAMALSRNEEDAADRQQPLMIWYGIEPAVAADPASGVDLVSSARIPTVRRLVTRRIVEEIESEPEPVAALVALAAKDPERRKDIALGLFEGLQGWGRAPKPEGWDELHAKLVDSEDLGIRDAAETLAEVFGVGRPLEELIPIVRDIEFDASARRSAFASLTRETNETAMKVIQTLVNDKVLGVDARLALAAYDHPSIATQLTRTWPKKSEAQQEATIDTLSSRPNYAMALLEAMKSGRIPIEAVSPYQARQISNLGDDRVTAMLGEVWGEVRETPEAKKAELQQWRDILTPDALASANAERGRTVFNSACAACHRLYGEGGAIGPELTGSDRHNLDYLLENIIDPNAVVPVDYQLSVFTLKDGRVISGVVPEENTRILTVQTPAERLSIEKTKIVERKKVPVSLMPEGLLGALSREQATDLFAYLMSR
jgi:putative membrane-bound dehydrogenase-like protein